MKRSLIVFPAVLILSTLAYGQDSAGTPKSTGENTQAPVAYGSGSPGYGSEGYGGHAEIFVSGFGMLTSHAGGDSISHEATNAGGFAAGYQFRLNTHSALEGRYGFVRNSQKYDVGGSVSSIPTYLSEITASYIFRFPKMGRMQPFMEGGGGLIHISPGNYSNGSITGSMDSGGGSGVANPTPYAAGGLITPVSFAAPIYSGSTPGIASQTRPAFVYGAGVDMLMSSHVTLRLEYRGLGYKTPDFGVAGLQTNAYSFLSEPSFGVAYRF